MLGFMWSNTSNRSYITQGQRNYLAQSNIIYLLFVYIVIYYPLSTHALSVLFFYAHNVFTLLDEPRFSAINFKFWLIIHLTFSYCIYTIILYFIANVLFRLIYTDFYSFGYEKPLKFVCI